MTGGFGEATCAACHFDFDHAPPPGHLAVTGLPDCYSDGERHELVVELRDPDMRVAGFQLALRFPADTTQAGELRVPPSEAARVAILTDRGTQFAHQTTDGATPAEPGATRWRLEWRAPPTRRHVLLHAAAIAGDNDQSQAGDRVYSIQLDICGK